MGGRIEEFHIERPRLAGCAVALADHVVDYGVRECVAVDEDGLLGLEYLGEPLRAGVLLAAPFDAARRTPARADKRGYARANERECVTGPACARNRS